MVIGLGVGPIEADQDDAALGGQARSKREFAEIGVGGDDDSSFPLREIQNHGILGSGHHLFDPEHIMTVPTQSGDGRAWHVLIGEKVHELSP